jgi:hypothetical protein
MEISDQSSFAWIAAELLRTVEGAVPKLRSRNDAHVAQPRAPGKWSPKQVMGHLIDPAANNHQRFVRAQEGTELVLPGYTQDHWVGVQGYQDASWDDIITLWRAYNRHLSHVIGRIPESRRAQKCTIGSSPPITLAFLAFDYVRHMRHHLDQAGALPD